MSTPVAIVGVGLRAPGAENADEFWHILASAKETVAELPPSRAVPGTPPRGGIVDGLSRFDHEFFAMSAASAEALDPGARKLLEVVWDACEDAAIKPSALKKVRVGTYVGSIAAHAEPPPEGAFATILGHAHAGLATRISFTYGLRGPSLTIDTDRSSALVALAQAVRDLRAGHIEMALVCGVNTLLNPSISRAFGEAGLLSPDGQCRFGDAGANGFVRSEGLACVVLMPQAQAVALGLRTYALVGGVAVNHDAGRGQDYLNPSVEAQTELVRAALDDASLTPSDIGYVEAHGTGTPTGDTIELGGLDAVFRGVPHPVFVGSVKSNIGHTEGAAGLFGVIKTALALWHGVLPQTLHVRQPNPAVDWGQSSLTLARERLDWPNELPRRAAVSAFGLTGTNANCVLEAAAPMPVRSPSPEAGPQVVVLSAPHEVGLRALAAAYAKAKTLPGIDELSRRLNAERELLAWRLVGLATSTQDAQLEWGKFAAGENSWTMQARRTLKDPARVVFVCPGQGGQWLGMGRELWENSAAFRTHVGRVDDELQRQFGWRASDGWNNDADLGRIERVQPMLFAMSIGLAAQWQQQGLTFDAVVGTSMGEVAAAVISGSLPLAAGVRVIGYRSLLMSRLGGRGAMLSVLGSPATVEELLAVRPSLSVAAYNGPASTVVAGGREAIAEFRLEAERRGLQCRMVRVDAASHCSEVDPILDELEDGLGSLGEPVATQSFVSTVACRRGVSLGARYWRHNLRQPVRLAGAVSLLLDEGFNTFVELGPHDVLTAAISDCVEERDSDALVLGSMERDESATRTIGRARLRLVAAAALPIPEPAGPAGAGREALPHRPWLSVEYPLRQPAVMEGPRDGGRVSPQADARPGVEQTLRDRLASAPLADRRRMIAERCADLVRSALRWPPSRAVPEDRGFRELGLTSVMMVDVRSRLGREVGASLPATYFFERPTIAKVAADLAKGDAPAQSLLGNILVECGFVNRSQLAEALRQQEKQPGRRLGEVLMNLGFVTPEQLQRALASQMQEPIAIVGMALRFPGGVRSPEDYWRLLIRGADAITRVPAARWSRRESPALPEWGGFIDGVDEFDFDFFGIGAGEAARMDPQQRLLMQIAWHALEHASIDPLSLRDTQTGVFVGVSNYNEYARLKERRDGHAVTAFDGVGDANSILAGRLSYTLGLLGPAMAVDTACSSSLVALHLAAQSLKNQECTMALAGGVSLILSPHVSETFLGAGMLAADGRCKTFDASADGYVRSEGCALVVLKTMSRALRDGDRIWALVDATAVNQDGRSAGLTAPNGEAQEALLRTALVRASRRPEDVTYVEAHGTGTRLGDPVELRALGRVYADRGAAARPLLVGSAKSNLGHLEAAAGMAGLIKVVLALDAGELPPSLHVKTLNPAIDWPKENVVVVTQRTPWPATEGRVAAVSSFGFSGTNAHVILQGSPSASTADALVLQRPVHPLLLSGVDEPAVRRVAAAWAEYIAAHPGESLAEIAHTLNCGRARQAWCLGVVAASREGAIDSLREVAAGAGRPVRWAPAGVVVRFGASTHAYPGLGGHIHSCNPFYRNAFETCLDALAAASGEPFREGLLAAGGAWTPREQVLLTFASGVALYRCLQSWGVEVDALQGEGVGAIVAALVAGAVDLPEASAAVWAIIGRDRGAPKGELRPAKIPWRCPDGAPTGVGALVEMALAGERRGAPLELTDDVLVAGPSSTGVALLERDDEWGALCRGLCRVAERGALANFRPFDAGYSRGFVPGPPYPFARTPVWLGKTAGASERARWVRAGAASTGAFSFEMHLSGQSAPEVFDHVVYDRVVVPGAFYLATLLALLREESGLGSAISGFTVQRPLVLAGEDEVSLSLTVAAGNDRGGEFEIARRDPSGEVLVLASGRFGPSVESAPPLAFDVPVGLGPSLDAETVYENLAEASTRFGPRFRAIASLAHNERGDAVVFAQPPGAANGEGGRLPAALVDVPFQTASFLASRDSGSAMVFFGVGNVEQRGEWAGGPLRCVIQHRGEGLSDAVILNDDGSFALFFRGASVLPASPAFLAARPDPELAWLYDSSWQQELLPPGSVRAEPNEACVIIHNGEADAANTIARAVRKAGRAADVVTAEALLAGGAVDPSTRYVFLLQESPAEISDSETMKSAVTATLRPLLRFLKSMSGGGVPARLSVVSRGAQRCRDADELRRPWQATAWGAIRSIRREMPELDARLIDVSDFDACLPALVTELAVGREEEVCLRPDDRRVLRLVPMRAPAVAEAEIERGSHIVTGGLGSLGLSVAEWLAAKGAEEIVLIGRHAPPPDVEARIARMRQQGATVFVEQASVVDPQAVTRTCRAARERTGRIAAIVHAAGVLRDATLVEQTWENLEEVLWPKVIGALNLLREAAPDTVFVSFSSIVGLVGNGGQLSYGAANAFLDAFAQQHVPPGKRHVSIAWGPWADSGMAARTQTAIRREGILGLQPVSTLEGIRILERSWGGKHPQVVVLSGSKRAIAEHFAPGAVPAKLREALGISPAIEEADRGAERFGRTLLALPAEAALVEAHRLVASEVARVLGVAEVASNAAFKDLGFDSLMAVELRNRLAKRTGLPLPPTVAFDQPTVTQMATHLYERLGGGNRKKALPAVTAPDEEPLAIVGMACRYPGRVDSPESFWRLLAEGGDGIEPFPSERWDVASIYDPNPDAPGKTYSREGGFLHAVDQFDAEFFGVGENEAAAMDPQQRLLLEVSWEAFERAGIEPRTLRGSATGVYVGLMYSDYGAVSATPEQLTGYVTTGSLGSVASGRLSYFYGLQGPAMTVDTACSSSLVALHLAAQALRAGECTQALVAGVTIMTTPSVFIEFSRLGGLARGGRSKSFSEDADGVSWAEGCGVLVLKRLSEALKAGDEVLGVVRATAVNQDGRSNGLTAPNGPSQVRLIEDALARGRLDPSQIDYIEGHGTGTTLGDPIEVAALAEVFGGSRQSGRPLVLGSVKSNIGHTQAAAGVAGIIKVILSLAHESIPSSLYAERPTKNVAWDGSGLLLANKSLPWVRGARPRRAGVSSFGIGGTNAHVIIEEPPRRTAPAALAPRGAAAQLLVLSAKSEAALTLLARRYSAFLGTTRDALSDIAFTALRHREQFAWRLALVATSKAEAKEKLERYLNGERPQGLWTGEAKATAASEASSEGERNDEDLAGSGRQWVLGATDLRALPWRGKRVEVPPYAFDRKRYWLDAGPLARRVSSSLMGHAMESASHADEIVYDLDLAERGAWDGHRVGTHAVWPAAGHLWRALRAAATLYSMDGATLRDVEITRAAVLLGGDHLQQSLRKGDGHFDVHVRSRDADPWQLCARGTAGRMVATASTDGWHPTAGRREIGEEVYRRFAAVGADYTGMFRSLRAVYESAEQTWAE
ncbi:MAG: SDR family NAD(P)-dependent oxidoreductase, partial [Deltaproteobacteria bacterium]|nr:SDR family NAD(P)-dependent oxidoreductase [Deltaproteobacteria bacterium]